MPYSYKQNKQTKLRNVGLTFLQFVCLSETGVYPVLIPLASSRRSVIKAQRRKKRAKK